MSDFGGISRLQQEQQKTLKNCELMIEKWEKFQEDYKALHGQLNDLPKKTMHEIMVPVGPLAFMPGQLIHTNEIMVLLGDNWFAERSASQAVEIAQRRLKNVEEYLGNLRQEHENVLSHMAFTSDIANVKNQSDFKEIKEELSEKDRQRIGQRTNRVAYSRATKDSVKRVNLKTVSDTDYSASTSHVKDKDLFARLDELETRELSNNELNDRNVNTFEGRSCGVHEKGGTNEDALTTKKSKKRVKWKEGFVDEKDKETVAFPKDERTTITFAHSKEKATPKENQSIASPADIFNDYLRKNTAQTLQQDTHERPRPILKNSNNESEPKEKIFSEREQPQSSRSVGDDSLARGQDRSDEKVQEKVVSAFADLVVEHKDNPDSGNWMRKEEKQETRKISKFKAARMKNK